MELKNNNIKEAEKRIADALEKNSEHLDLSDLRLTTLPESITQLAQLTTLDLSSNQLATLPECITQLAQLTTLNLSYNQLDTLPESITQLAQLTTLKLSSNRLATLPKCITQPAQLTTLDLGGNRLTTLPECITQLAQLTTLKLSSNWLATLPECITQLAQLTTLDLSSNWLDTLPECITQLAQLTTLDLSSNQLATLPECITQLAQLTTLNLSYNQLDTLPESITQLAQLTTLKLSSNRLATLPKCITQLAQLTTLDLSRNKLTTLPECITQLVKLTTLNLESNQLTTTTLPECITQLAQLTTLNLSYNRLTDLPETITQLAQLRTLDLGNNQLTTLPEFITQLAQLTTLSLRCNWLTTLPECITQLAQLTTLDLRHNRLKQPPQALCNWGVKAVMAFYSPDSLKSLPLFQRILIGFFNQPSLEKPINIIAITQTVLMSLAAIVVFFEYQWSLLWLSVFFAPFVLTRTDETIEYGLKIYHQKAEWLNIRSRPKSRLVFFAKFIWLGLLCVGIKIYATVRGWFIAPLAALKSMPDNFAFYFSRCSVMDLPELLPNMEKQYGEESDSSFSFYDLGEDFTADWPWETSKAYRLIAGLGMGLFFVIALLFRFSVKVSALIYALPLMLFLPMRIPADDQRTSRILLLFQWGLIIPLIGLHFRWGFVKQDLIVESLPIWLDVQKIQVWLESGIGQLLSDMFYSPVATAILFVLLLYGLASGLYIATTKGSKLKQFMFNVMAFFDHFTFLLFPLYAMCVLIIVGNHHLWPWFKTFL